MTVERKLSYDEEQRFYLSQAERKLRLLRTALLKPGAVTPQQAETLLVRIRSGDSSVYPEVTGIYKKIQDTEIESLFWDSVQMLGMLDAKCRSQVSLKLTET